MNDNDFRACEKSVVAMNNTVKKHTQEKSYHYVVLFALLVVMIYW